MRALLVRAIAAAGFEILAHAQDADAAIASARDLEPDVFVVDARLPGGGAPGIVSRIREAAPATAIFVVVSLAERDVLGASIAAGASGGLIRPLRPADVAAALVRVAKS